MKKGECKLKIFTHNFYENGTEGEELHLISYYKIPKNQRILFKNNNKKNKSEIQNSNNDLNLNSLFHNTNNQNKKSNSKNKNSNNTTYNHNKDSYPESTVSGTMNKYSKTYNNTQILNNSQNINTTFKSKSKIENNKNKQRSKSPNQKKLINNQISKFDNEKISKSINDIIIIKGKINDLIRKESELEKQKYDIIDHFEYKLKPMRELNQKLMLEYKVIIDKFDELNGKLALLKNQYSQLINQLNEKKDIVEKLNSTYENDKEIFDKQVQEDESKLYNYYTQAVEDLENGKEIEIDDMP
jgi:hypothetical protein